MCRHVYTWYTLGLRLVYTWSTTGIHAAIIFNDYSHQTNSLWLQTRPSKRAPGKLNQSMLPWPVACCCEHRVASLLVELHSITLNTLCHTTMDHAGCEHTNAANLSVMLECVQSLGATKDSTVVNVFGTLCVYWALVLQLAHITLATADITDMQII